MILAVQRGESERQELRLWEPLLDRLGQRALDPPVLADAGPWLGVRLFVLPPGSEVEAAPQGGGGRLATLTCRLEAGGATQLLVTGPPEALQAMAQVVTTQKGSVHPVPAWLQANAASNHAYASRRLGELERGLANQGSARRSPRCSSATTWRAPSAMRTACSGCCRTCTRWKPASCCAGSPAGRATRRSAP